MPSKDGDLFRQVFKSFRHQERRMDRDEFLEVWHRTQPALRSQLFRLGAGQEADDLLQELFLRVYKRVDSAGVAASERYLVTAARRLVIDRTRQRQRRRTAYVLSRPANASYENPHDLYIAEQREAYFRTEVQPALESLPPKYREAVDSFMYWDNQSVAARELEIPESTLRSRRDKALERLRHALYRKRQS